MSSRDLDPLSPGCGHEGSQGQVGGWSSPVHGGGGRVHVLEDHCLDLYWERKERSHGVSMVTVVSLLRD